MQASDTAIQLIRRFEGFRAAPYLCPSGVPTIGYGHTAGVTMAAKPITEEQATVLLAADLARFERAVEEAIRIPLEQHEFDALVSFVFNIGVSAFRTSTLVRYLNGGDRSAAAVEFERWNKGRVRGTLIPLTGLSLRRTAERRLFEGRSGT
jgi:lysozyme